MRESLYKITCITSWCIRLKTFFKTSWPLELPPQQNMDHIINFWHKQHVPEFPTEYVRCHSNTREVKKLYFHEIKHALLLRGWSSNHWMANVPLNRHIWNISLSVLPHDTLRHSDTIKMPKHPSICFQMYWGVLIYEISIQGTVLCSQWP